MKTLITSVHKLLLFRLNLVIYFLAFTIPVVISHPLWIVGTVINCLLYLTAERLSEKSILPVVVLPSLGAIIYGVLFGPQTVFLYYFLPFIWLGNYTLIKIFVLTKNQNFFLRTVFASSAKFLLLFSFAKIYFGFQIVPQLFVTSMGIVQLVTALAGGILAYFILQFSKSKYE